MYQTAANTAGVYCILVSVKILYNMGKYLWNIFHAALTHHE